MAVYTFFLGTKSITDHSYTSQHHLNGGKLIDNMFRTLKSWFATKWFFIRLSLPHQTLIFFRVPILCCLFLLRVFAVLTINILRLRCMHCTHTSLFCCVCCYRSCLWQCIAFHFVCMPIIKPMGNHFFLCLSSLTRCEHAKKNFHTCVDCAIFLHPNEWKSSFDKKKSMN